MSRPRKRQGGKACGELSRSETRRQGDESGKSNITPCLPVTRSPLSRLPSSLTHRHLRPEFTDNGSLRSTFSSARPGAEKRTFSPASTARSCKPPSPSWVNRMSAARCGSRRPSGRPSRSAKNCSAAASPPASILASRRSHALAGRVLSGLANAAPRAVAARHARTVAASDRRRPRQRAAQIPGPGRSPRVVRRAPRRALSRAQAARRHSGGVCPRDPAPRRSPSTRRAGPALRRLRTIAPSPPARRRRRSPLRRPAMPWSTTPALFADLEIVVADGFTDFTHTQLEILAALAGRSGRLLISLPGELDGGTPAVGPSCSPSRTPPSPNLRCSFQSSRSNGCRAARPPGRRSITSRSTCSSIRATSRRPRPRPIASLDRLEIVAAAGVHDEIVELARNIKQRLVDERNRTGQRPAGRRRRRLPQSARSCAARPRRVRASSASPTRSKPACRSRRPASCGRCSTCCDSTPTTGRFAAWCRS